MGVAPSGVVCVFQRLYHATDTNSSTCALIEYPFVVSFLPQFNIAIIDQPDVLAETKKVLQISQHESIVTRLPLCVEISLQTVEGDNMILEVWSLSVQSDQCDAQLRTTHSIYNRMGLLLKSLLSVTRSTPAYKLSRRQSGDSYQIFYRIYIGEAQTHQLGK